MKTDRIYVLRESIAKIAQILAGSDIEVTQRGTQAYVRADSSGKPLQVNLPFIPDNATQELCDAIQGFLDHEIGHIRFSDWTVLRKSNERGQAFASTVNVLEDPRVEKAMAGEFKGASHNLDNTGRFFLNKIVIPNLRKAQAEGQEAIEANLFVPMIRAMAGQLVFKEFMKDHLHKIQGTFDKIKDLAPRIEAAASTQDCYDIALEIESRLCPPATSGTPTFGGTAGGGSGSGGASAGKSKGKGGKVTLVSREEDEEAPAPGEEEEKTSPTAAPGEEEESEEEKSSAPSPGEEEGGGTMEAGKSAALWDKLNKDEANDYDSALSREISDMSIIATKNSPYRVFSNEFDTVEPLHVGSGFNATMLKGLEDETAHMVNSIQKDLERAISARSLAVRSHGHRSGKLHSSNLTRLVFNDPRVFSRKHETTTKDVAVSLVIDMSGSMSGAKVHCAAQTAYALSSTLERLAIKHEVICFTTKGYDGKDWSSEIQAEERKAGIRFSRHEALYMPVIKGFDERHTTNVKNRFAWLPHCNTMRNNVDGESVMVAARRLLGRRETGKIMLVLSDGAPAASGGGGLDEHLRNTVKELSSHMRIVGIGIQSDAPRKYYPKNVMINNVKELPEKVIGQLKEALLDQSK